MFSDTIQNFIQEKNYPGLHPKAVFFDMDGVLIDSMKFHASAWVQALNDIKIPFSHYEAYMNEGRTGHSTIDGAFMKTHGRTATEKEKQQIYGLKSKYFESYGPSERMPYALELLEKIKAQHLQIFLVTGSGQPTLINSLQQFFPGIFQKDKMITAFDVKQGKPFPEPYLKALKKSGVEPWEAVVIENAPLGVEAGSRAGLFTIGVNTGPLEKRVLLECGSHVVLDNMNELYCQWDSFYSQCMNLNNN